MPSDRTVRDCGPADRDWIRQVLEEHWGGTTMMIRDREFDCLSLPALTTFNREGILIYRPSEPVEIILIEALTTGSGVGAALLDALVQQLQVAKKTAVRVTTTNDNTDALCFYQKRGFRLVELRVGAVDRARHLKASIPLTGARGIAIHDELELELVIR
jgi:GNAT superfamily N-acetyltransferase